jgi:hypothetical protein
MRNLWGFWGNYGGSYVKNVWGFLGRYVLCKKWGFFFFFFFFSWGWLLPMFPLPQMEIGEQRKLISSGRRNPTIKKRELRDHHP